MLSRHPRIHQHHPAALRRLICLCSDCHRVTHYGLAQLNGTAGQALAHLRTVTGMTSRQASAHVGEAFVMWRVRSLRAWTLDLSMLTGAGITLRQPPSAAERTAAADREVAVVRRGSSPPAGSSSTTYVADCRAAPGCKPRRARVRQ